MQLDQPDLLDRKVQLDQLAQLGLLVLKVTWEKKELKDLLDQQVL